MWEDPEIYQIWTLNQANQNDWPKKTRKKCPIYVIQTTMRAQLSLLVHQCVYPHVLYSFSPNKHFTCFTTFHLCGNSFLQRWRARPLSLTTGLVSRFRCSHHHDLTSISGQERKPCFKPLQAKATGDQSHQPATVEIKYPETKNVVQGIADVRHWVREFGVLV